MDTDRMEEEARMWEARGRYDLARIVRSTKGAGSMELHTQGTREERVRTVDAVARTLREYGGVYVGRYNSGTFERLAVVRSNRDAVLADIIGAGWDRTYDGTVEPYPEAFGRELTFDIPGVCKRCGRNLDGSYDHTQETPWGDCVRYVDEADRASDR
jgi:hypothetical protein